MNINKKDTNKIDSNGLKQGLWKYQYSNGELMFIVNFVNGILEGEGVIYEY